MAWRFKRLKKMLSLSSLKIIHYSVKKVDFHFAIQVNLPITIPFELHICEVSHPQNFASSLVCDVCERAGVLFQCGIRGGFIYMWSLWSFVVLPGSQGWQRLWSYGGCLTVVSIMESATWGHSLRGCFLILMGGVQLDAQVDAQFTTELLDSSGWYSCYSTTCNVGTDTWVLLDSGGWDSTRRCVGTQSLGCCLPLVGGTTQDTMWGQLRGCDK